MSNLDFLQVQNKHLSFYHVNDSNFLKYGKVLDGYGFAELELYMRNAAIPEEGNVYMPSVPEMEKTAIKEQIQTNFYGGMPIQIGYCNGRNSTLNGLEYHKGSEINIAWTDFVLLVGQVKDIKDNAFSTKNVDAFFVPEGTAVELFGTTLHFSPCKVNEEGFKATVILPDGTNKPLEQPINKITLEDELLFMKNKWLLVHKARKVLVEKGAYIGLQGENLRVNY